MSLKIALARVVLSAWGLLQGKKRLHSQPYEDHFLYMDKAEKYWWGYKCVIRQPELAEEGSGIEEHFASQDLRFSPPEGFVPSSSLSLCAGGDLNASPWIRPDNTERLFDGIEGFYFSGDIVCANLETPINSAGLNQGVPRMSFSAPRLNSTPEMFERFGRGGRGIGLFSTANNHCLDQGEAGLVDTLDFLDEGGYLHVGTARTAAERAAFPIVERNGVKVAFLAYTYSMNAQEPIPGKEYMTNYLRLNKPDTDIGLIREQVEAARARGADIVVAMLHWSVEFETYPLKNVMDMGHRVMDLGVDVILGSHPHVSQPMEKRSFVDPSTGRAKQGFIAYSLGDFVAHEPFTRNSRISTVLRLELAKGTLDGRPFACVSGLEALPILIALRDFGGGSEELRLLDYERVMEGISSGDDPYAFDRRERAELERLGVLLRERLLPRRRDAVAPRVRARAARS